MGIIGGLDVHRAQITFDYIDTATGQVRRGRIRPALREDVRAWLERFGGQDDVAFALEGTTGWLYVVEELQRAGIRAHLAEPADTSALRGPKRRAKTDGADAKLMRELLQAGRLPESWVPPPHVEQIRTLVRLRQVAPRRAHRVVPAPAGQAGAPRSPQPRCPVFGGPAGMARPSRCPVRLSPGDLGGPVLDRPDQRGDGPDRRPAQADRPPPAGGQGPRAPDLRGGVAHRRGHLDGARGRRAVRHLPQGRAPHRPGHHRALLRRQARPGHLSRQGPEVLRWALFEAALSASREGSPDHAYCQDVKARQDAHRAFLSQARRIARKAYHVLLEMGEQALAPVPGLDLAPTITKAA